jgi:hypothetical protein
MQFWSRCKQSRTDRLVFAPIACELTALGEKDEVGCTVPLLDDVESFVDFASQRFRMKIATQEDRFEGFAEFGQRLVCRMLDACQALSFYIAFGKGSSHFASFESQTRRCGRSGMRCSPHEGGKPFKIDLGLQISTLHQSPFVQGRGGNCRGWHSRPP